MHLPKSLGVRSRRQHVAEPDHQPRHTIVPPSPAVPRPLEPRPTPQRRELINRLGLHQRRWTILTYAVILLAALLIFSVTYTTYTFSRYQGLVLPGVYVDTVPVGGQSWYGASKLILERLSAINNVPTQLSYHGHVWQPTIKDLGLYYDVNTTVDHAYAIGRTGNFWQDLFDRLPLKRRFHVALLYHCALQRPHQPPLHSCAEAARAWVLRTLVPAIQKLPTNAQLVIRHDHVVVIPSHDGYRVDVNAAVDIILARFGSLSIRRDQVPITLVHPVIGDAPVLTLRDRVERFFASPPVLVLGREHIHTTRAILARMISFKPQVTQHSAAIVMQIDTAKLTSYIAGVAASFDVPARNPQLLFNDGRVTMLAPRRVGRVMDQHKAEGLLIAAFQSLAPHQFLHIPVRRVQPAIDLSNPASLGINSLLGEGESSFFGSPAIRLADIRAIAARLNGVLIHPHQEISFNYYAGIDWPARVYNDTERRAPPAAPLEFVPGRGGAMQQVATTFFRAAYAAGLPLLERHPHPYRLPWYEPPIGLDAIVSPNGDDLRFQNTTGGFILIETRVEPIQGVLYIYLYGPKLNWTVTVSNPRVLKTYPPGPPIMQPDPNLPAGAREQLQFAHPGADVLVKRTVVIHGPHGNIVHSDELRTYYQPWHAVILIGPGASPTATPTIVTHRQHHKSHISAPPPPPPGPGSARTLPTVTPPPTATPSPTNTPVPTATPGSEQRRRATGQRATHRDVLVVPINRS
jgi:vancomycin resistance protein YoaR